MAAEDLEKLASSFGLKGTAIKDVNQAIEAARRSASAEDLVFVGGSNFVVAEIENL
jgi:dihydrofolate synthase/folylpolyglutamate synthase